MIEVIIRCEAMRDSVTRCENNTFATLDEEFVRLSREGEITFCEGLTVKLPEGWGTFVERGCPRIICDDCVGSEGRDPRG